MSDDTFFKSKIPGILVSLEQYRELSHDLERRLLTLEQNGIPGVADFFATSALSCLANSAVAAAWKPKDVAEFAYDVAEKMMEERAKRNVK